LGKAGWVVKALANRTGWRRSTMITPDVTAITRAVARSTHRSEPSVSSTGSSLWPRPARVSL
jgi:hypothetical protein